MPVRERWEELEKTILSPHAALSANTRGRERPEKPCDYRTDYQRDRDRILHCKSSTKRRCSFRPKATIIAHG